MVKQTLNYFKQIDAKTAIQLGFAGVVAAVLFNVFISQYTANCDNDREIAKDNALHSQKVEAEAAEARRVQGERTTKAIEKMAEVIPDIRVAAVEMANASKVVELTNKTILKGQERQESYWIETRAWQGSNLSKIAKLVEGQDRASLALVSTAERVADVAINAGATSKKADEAAKNAAEAAKNAAEAAKKAEEIPKKIDNAVMRGTEERKGFWIPCSKKIEGLCKFSEKVETDHKAMLERLPPKPANTGPPFGMVPK